MREYLPKTYALITTTLTGNTLPNTHKSTYDCADNSFAEREEGAAAIVGERGGEVEARCLIGEEAGGLFEAFHVNLQVMGPGF